MYGSWISLYKAQSILWAEKIEDPTLSTQFVNTNDPFVALVFKFWFIVQFTNTTCMLAVWSATVLLIHHWLLENLWYINSFSSFVERCSMCGSWILYHSPKHLLGWDNLRIQPELIRHDDTCSLLSWIMAWLALFYNLCCGGLVCFLFTYTTHSRYDVSLTYVLSIHGALSKNCQMLLFLVPFLERRSICGSYIFCI
jgi:hypothetical protein